MTSKLQLGVSTAAFFPHTLEETFDILAQQPWRGIEFMPQTPDECRPAFAEELMRLANACTERSRSGRFQFCGIHFPQILAPFLYNPYPGAFAYGQQLCRDIGALAGELGCTTIVVHGPWEHMSEGIFLDATLANLRLLCDRTAVHNVTIALENTPSCPLTDSPARLLAFGQQIDRPNLGFTVDITHAYQLDQDPMIYIEGVPIIAHIHASDFDTTTNQRHTAPGDGVVDWENIITTLRHKGFAGNFILELLPKTLGDDPVKTLQTATALLDPLFADWPGAV